MILITVERYSESESQIGNSGSEDNCNFNNSNVISGNSKETSGKNHTSGSSSYSQNGTVCSSDANTQFSNGPVTNGNLDIIVPVKDNLPNNKDINKLRPANNAKKNNNKRSRNR